jgi:hypothetical protein
MSNSVIEFVEKKGVQFADARDAGGALLKIASDPSINGKKFQLLGVPLHVRLILESGRCLTVIPREDDAAPFGYCDFDVDDYPEGTRAYEQQQGQLKYSHRLQVNSTQQ